MGPHGWAADLQTVEQAYAMADMAKADVPADEGERRPTKRIPAAGPPTNRAPLPIGRRCQGRHTSRRRGLQRRRTFDAAAIAVAVRDPDGRPRPADSGAHRNSVVRAYGGADDRAHQQADGRTHFEANRRTFSGAHGRAYACTKRCAERRSDAFTERDAELAGSDRAADGLAYLSADANSDGRSHGCDATSERATVAGSKRSERVPTQAPSLADGRAVARALAWPGSADGQPILCQPPRQWRLGRANGHAHSRADARSSVVPSLLQPQPDKRAVTGPSPAPRKRRRWDLRPSRPPHPARRPRWRQRSRRRSRRRPLPARCCRCPSPSPQTPTPLQAHAVAGSKPQPDKRAVT